MRYLQLIKFSIIIINLFIFQFSSEAANSKLHHEKSYNTLKPNLNLPLSPRIISVLESDDIVDSIPIEDNEKSTHSFKNNSTSSSKISMIEKMEIYFITFRIAINKLFQHDIIRFPKFSEIWNAIVNFFKNLFRIKKKPNPSMESEDQPTSREEEETNMDPPQNIENEEPLSLYQLINNYFSYNYQDAKSYSNTYFRRVDPHAPVDPIIIPSNKSI